MVSDYIDWSFGGSTLLFLADVFNRIVPVDLQPSVFLNSGASSSDLEVEQRMTRLLASITNKLQQPLDNLSVRVQSCNIQDYYQQPSSWVADMLGHHNIVEVETEFYPKGEVKLQSIELHTGSHTFEA